MKLVPRVVVNGVRFGLAMINPVTNPATTPTPTPPPAPAPAREGEGRGVVNPTPRRRTAGEGEDRRDRKVEAAGEDDEGEADRHQALWGPLAGHAQQVRLREEF